MQNSIKLLIAPLRVDEAAKGVGLPTRKMMNDYQAAGKTNWLDGVGPVHETIHTDAYRTAVLARLRLVKAQPANIIRDELQRIGQELVEGTFPW